MNDITELKECVACGGQLLVPVLNLGNQPLANSYKDTKNEVQEEYPLAINRCDNCYHVQLTHAVNPDLLFKNYLYVSGTSNTMRQYFSWFADWSIETYFLVAGGTPHTVLDIGCNDGTQLDVYKINGMQTFGVDPAENLLATSLAKGHKVYNQYFDESIGGIYDILIAQNVFAHNSNPMAFLRNAFRVMDGESLLFVQTSQADMIKNNEFDTIYHEHISFYNIMSMDILCYRAGMYLVDVIKTPLHGNSYVFVISKNPRHARPEHIHNLMEMEKKSGLYSPETYVEYEKRCTSLVNDLKNAVSQYTRSDIRYLAIGYGAAAKGMTLLNYSKLKLDYIIDDNPLKQGKFTPGAGIPIYGPEKLTEHKTDPCVFVPLAWNFFDEISEKIYNARKNDYDIFVTYFPKVKVTRKNRTPLI